MGRAGPWRSFPVPPSKRANPDGFRRHSRRRAQTPIPRGARRASSFLRLILGGCALPRDLILVEIAERLRSGIERQHTCVVGNGEIVESHDPWQLSDFARESAHVVIVARDLDG